MIYLCSLPCQLCGWFCDRFGSALDTCCGDVHRCCEKPCSGFAVMTIALAGSACFSGLYDFALDNDDYDSLILAGISALHVLFALYVQSRFTTGLREEAMKRAQLSGEVLASQRQQEQLTLMW